MHDPGETPGDGTRPRDAVTADEPISVVLEKAGSTGAVTAAKTETPKTETPKTEVKVGTQPKSNGGSTTVAKTETPKTETPKTETPKTETPKTETPKTETPKTETPKTEAKGEGTLLLGSKPPCDIFIDGKATGLQTPQRDIKLPSGKHKITLVNNEYGIKETFVVEVKADSVERAIKDYSDRIPK